MTSRFPADFLWGAATSAYQTEGSLDVDGRGPSVWDSFATLPGTIEGGGDASIATDSYRRWRDDVDLIGDLGLQAYRFSTAWSRVVPDGRGAINEKALDHYERFVDALLEKGVEPVLTLNHWDMPEALMDRGGWLDRGSVDAFVHYATAVADRLGDRVPWWITQCEPWIVQLLGYQLGIHAPGLADLPSSVRAGHHILLAHGAGYDAIRGLTTGKIGCGPNLLPCVPATDSEEDRLAAIGSDGYVNRWYLDPLFLGRYPDDMREHWERVAGPLDFIRDGDLAQIGGRMDFLGLNFYSRRVMKAAPVGENGRPFPWQVVRAPEESRLTDEGTEIVPGALTDLLVRLKNDYLEVPILITENGLVSNETPEHDGAVHDVRRIRFLRVHLEAMGEAIAQGVNLVGYLHWSLLDNFEWALGYRPRFGLVYVDYPTLERTPKDSARHYSALIAANGDLDAVAENVGKAADADASGVFG